MIAPKFVSHGGMQSYPAPSSFTGVQIHGFILDAARDKTAAYVDKVLNQPAAGAVQYAAFASHAMLSFVYTAKGVFKEYTQMGYGSEREAVFWIPVARLRKHGPITVVDHVAWLVPYIWNDNPVAIVSGRDVFGFFKELGWSTMPDAGGPPGPFTLDTFGAIHYSPETHIERHRLIDLNPADPNQSRTIGAAWPTVEHAARALHTAFGAGDTVTIPGLGLFRELLDLLLHKRMPLVFLKQFRDAASSDGCVYQAIVEADATIDQFSGFQLENDYDFVLHQMDSHPIEQELGISSQSARMVFDAEMAFTMNGGNVVWQAEG